MTYSKKHKILVPTDEYTDVTLPIFQQCIKGGVYPSSCFGVSVELSHLRNKYATETAELLLLGISALISSGRAKASDFQDHVVSGSLTPTHNGAYSFMGLYPKTDICPEVLAMYDVIETQHKKTIRISGRTYQGADLDELALAIVNGTLHNNTPHADNPHFIDRPGIGTTIGRSIDTANIEPGILPLVLALESNGLKPFASCEGHCNNAGPYLAAAVPHCAKDVAVSLCDMVRDQFAGWNLEISNHMHLGASVTLRYCPKLPKGKVSWTYGVTRASMDDSIKGMAAKLEGLERNDKLVRHFPNVNSLGKGQHYLIKGPALDLRTRTIIS